MKLWLSKNSEVPVREQLVTQITLGISSGDLEIGEKLPSRGEISRRFDIHANTVSNAYQKLSEQGLIEFRQGSGFFVCETKPENLNKNELDSLTAKFINNAQRLEFSIEEIQNSFQKYLQINSSENFLVIETDVELRKILIAEIKQKISFKVEGISFDEFAAKPNKPDSIIVALSDEKEKLEKILPAEKQCFYIKSRSIPESMRGESRPAKDSLIAVVSGWEAFLQMAKTILIAAEVEADSIIVRSTKNENWQRGLENASIVICDLLTAKKLEKYKNIRPFNLISDTSFQELEKLLKRNK